MRTAVAPARPSAGPGGVAAFDRWTVAEDVPVFDVYDAPGVAVYESLGTFGYDLSTPVVLAVETPGPLLELCCGAGRVGLPLLALGVDYVGVDTSAAMLDRFEEQAREQGMDTRGRLRRGDAVDVADLGRGRFARVLVPAFSLVLFDPPRRRALYAAVREVLAPGGLLTAEVYRSGHYDEVYADGRSTCRWSARDHGGYLVTLAELDGDREQVRFLEQRGSTPPTALRTTKWCLDSERLLSELERDGFEPVDRRPSLYPLAEWVTVRPRSAAGGR